ncbi:uncharacterized protein [Typha latifolia]|uniref:uncharacterized protein n=1 Tax=Typha latifolia TaxID=4733 RepID=UPI003C2B56CD
MAAARLLQRRLASILHRDRPQYFISRGFPWPLNVGIRGTHMKKEVSTDEGVEDPKSSWNDENLVSGSSERVIPTGESNVKYTAFSDLKASKRHDLAMIFTCKVCETRSVKTLCRESYEKGVVVARCGGCNNLHLIADRLGWFGEPGSVEDLLAARGEEVRRGSVDTLNLTLDDLVGNKS